MRQALNRHYKKAKGYSWNEPMKIINKIQWKTKTIFIF
jgi:hypothetical protein